MVWDELNHIRTEVLEYPNDQVAEQDIEDKIAFKKSKIQERIDFDAIRAWEYDQLSDDLKEIIKWMVVKIRNNPGATLIQAKTIWNAEMADEWWDFDKLAAGLQSRFNVPSWDAFKNYLINKKFEGVD